MIILEITIVVHCQKLFFCLIHGDSLMHACMYMQACMHVCMYVFVPQYIQNVQSDFSINVK